VVFDSQQLTGCGLASRGGLLEFAGWDVAEIVVKALRVVPVHRAEGRKFEVLDRSPGPSVCRSTDEFGLVVAVHGLGEGVV
jgi:hypothetical protein